MNSEQKRINDSKIVSESEMKVNEMNKFYKIDRLSAYYFAASADCSQVKGLKEKALLYSYYMFDVRCAR